MEEKIAIDLEKKHVSVNFEDLRTVGEMLKAEVRRTFLSGDKIGVCIGGKYTPYITIFLPSDMGYDVHKFVSERDLKAYLYDISHGYTPIPTCKVINDTRVRPYRTEARNWKDVILFCPGPYPLLFFDGYYRTSKAGKPCFVVDDSGEQTLIQIGWQKGQAENSNKPQIRWCIESGDPPPGVPRYRQHNWDFVNISGYEAPEILVDVPENYIKFAANCKSNNQRAGVMWFIVDRIGASK